MKRLLAAFSLLVLMSPTVLAAFSDVSAGHENYTAISYVQEEEIVGGYPDGSYQPDVTINRAEFTKIIVEATMSVDTSDTSLSGLSFSDIESGQWYIPYIRAATDAGIIDGYPDGTFKPGDPINFAEACKIIVNGFELSVGSSDVWYLPFVEELAESGAIPTSIEAYDSDVSRGEMAEMIYRLHADVTDLPSLNSSLNQYADAEYVYYTEDLYNEYLGSRPFILFFHAGWCPICLTHEDYIVTNLATYPLGTSFMEVDFDTEQSLRSEYGVVLQYTFVSIDENGEIVEKLTTSSTDVVHDLAEDLFGS